MRKMSIIDLHFPFSRKVHSGLSCYSRNSLICTHDLSASLSLSHFFSYTLYTLHTLYSNLDSINLKFQSMTECIPFILAIILVTDLLEFITIL